MTDLLTQHHQWLIYAIAALQALDGLTTIYNLTRPGAREANPFMVKLFSVVGVKAGVVVSKAAYAAFVLLYGNQIPPIALAGLCALYVAVVVNNVLVARKAAKHSTPAG